MPKGKKKSPLSRSKELLEERGYKIIEKTEHWNPWSRTRHDLFNIADLIGVRAKDVILVQTTTAANMGQRREKFADPEFKKRIRLLKKHFLIEIHGWVFHKRVDEWVCKTIRL